MKQLLLKFSFLLLTLTHIFAQTKDIEVIQNNVNGVIIISIKNNTSERKEVRLTVNGEGFEKVQMPIVKDVKKNEVTEFVKLKPLSEKGIKFTSNYTYLSKPTEDEIRITSKKIEAKKANSNIDFSKGIIVFTKTGCPRCNKTLNYLVDNNIQFKYMDVVKNQEFNDLMWEKLHANNISNEIIMPVIIINGKLTHSHKDLDSFLKKIIQ